MDLTYVLVGYAVGFVFGGVVVRLVMQSKIKQLKDIENHYGACVDEIAVFNKTLALQEQKAENIISELKRENTGYAKCLDEIRAFRMRVGILIENTQSRLQQARAEAANDPETIEFVEKRINEVALLIKEFDISNAMISGEKTLTITRSADRTMRISSSGDVIE